MRGCLSCAPYWGPGLQPRHVPWLGMEPETFWFAGRHTIHWATPGGAKYAVHITNKVKVFNTFKSQLYLFFCELSMFCDHCFPPLACVLILSYFFPMQKFLIFMELNLSMFLSWFWILGDSKKASPLQNSKAVHPWRPPWYFQGLFTKYFQMFIKIKSSKKMESSYQYLRFKW